MTLLQLHNVTKTFGEIHALNGIDFSITEGEVVGMVGPNGAGKTTLFNLISGRFKPNSGRIIFAGTEITGLKPHAMCRLGISRTFQSSRPFAKMTALENVIVGCVFGKEFYLRPRREDKDTARELLGMVDIAHKADTLAGDLTLSELRRLDLARALATRPRLLLLDEVAAGFSPVAVKQAVKLVLRVRDMGVTVLIIDHFLNLSLKVSDRLIALDFGEKIAEGPPKEMMKNRKVIKAYLGMRHEEEHE